MNGNYRTKWLTHFAVLTILASLLAATVSKHRVASAQTSDVSPSLVAFAENFNGVTPPGLPTGWATTQTGSGTSFSSVPGANTTLTTRAFTGSPDTSGLSDLTTPPILIDNAPTRLRFRHLFATEPTAG